jgi:hypothetical protein
MATKKKRQVVVTTQRGLFYGTLAAERDGGRTVDLTGARCGIYWATKGGFLELAELGPSSRSKVGNKAPKITLYDVTCVADCTPAAAEAWERA